MNDNQNDPLTEEEKEAIKSEEFSEPEGLVKSFNGDVEAVDEETIDAIETQKGAGDQDDPNKDFGFHIEK
jgi:hypothetical protein